MFDKIEQFAYTGAVAGFGALAHYLYEYTQNRKDFNWVMFGINIILGFFIGNLVGDVIPTTFIYRDGTLLVSGFCAYPLLRLLEDRGVDIILKIINGKSKRP